MRGLYAGWRCVHRIPTGTALTAVTAARTQLSMQCNPALHPQVPAGLGRQLHLHIPKQSDDSGRILQTNPLGATANGWHYPLPVGTRYTSSLLITTDSHNITAVAAGLQA